VDRRIGLVAHVPAGGGTCEIHTVDLELGWQGAQLAHRARSWRKSQFRLGEVGARHRVRRQWLADQVRRLVREYPDAARDLAQWWPAGVPTFKASDEHTDEQLEQIAALLRKVEGEHRIPFGDEPDPAHVASKQERKTA
jgi:hypothetical protein